MMHGFSPRSIAAELLLSPTSTSLKGSRGATLLQLEEVGDHAGLAEVWWVLARGVAAVRCHFEEQAHAAEQALAHSRVAGKEPPHLFGLHAAVTDGPRAAEDALRAIDAAMPGNTFHALQLNRARLLAMLGRFDEAWPVVLDADARMRELTDLDSGYCLAEIARLEGNHEGDPLPQCHMCSTRTARRARSTSDHGARSRTAALRGRPLR